MKRSLSTVVLVALTPFAFAGILACGSKKPKPAAPPPVEVVDAGPAVVEAPPPPAPKSLFERLGKKEGITAVVDTFVKNLKADAVVNKAFTKTTGPKEEHFKQMLVEQLCEATGGDCKYTGKNMKDAHKGMKITEKQWDAALTDLKLALDEHKVSDVEKTDVFALLAPMKADMVLDPKKK